MEDSIYADYRRGFMVSYKDLVKQIPVFRCGTLVIGTGCAGYNAADSLYDCGYQDILIVTEGIHMGTSRNTGSDKQTYYKLAMQSGQTDSIERMANTLFSGKSVNGDTAYVEAVNSVRSFMKLVNLGVPFPTNQYGEFVGYQTDHTTEKRATSAGPLTSKYMTEVLEKQVFKKQIKIMDHVVIVELLRDENGIAGAVGINKQELDGPQKGFVIFQADYVIMATGGPASIYQNKVYPVSQTGMTGMAIDAGAECVNLQEWQYGMASVKFRWNLSGTYQQVIPRYFSVDEDGNEYDFLSEYFDDPVDAMNLVFLKGYQWPFDINKIQGSSLIDMLVYNEEINKGRSVFIDYRREPEGLRTGLHVLGQEAYEYLKRSNALLDTPIKRLAKMNRPAIELYKNHGIDLYYEPLQITIAAQHNNGGIGVDIDWQTNINGLFVVGEAAGTFGVYRPGGSALNSCQVGGLRAAEKISRSSKLNKRTTEDMAMLSEVCRCVWEKIGNLTSVKMVDSSEKLKKIQSQMSYKMSAYGAHIRNVEKLEMLKKETTDALSLLNDLILHTEPADLPAWFKLRDMIVTQQAVLDSMRFAIRNIGSRGGALTSLSDVDFTNIQTIKNLAVTHDTSKDNQTLIYEKGKGCSFREVRPMPKPEDWFETVWEKYQKNEFGV